MGSKWPHNDPMAYNLRLPAALDADARTRCERLGISLNALLCVALDAYLRGDSPSPNTEDSPGVAGPGPAAAGRFVAEPGLPGAAPQAGGPAKLSKQQRREITRLQRQARKF